MRALIGGMRSVPKLLLVLMAVLLTACDDPFAPQRWVATPDTVDLWSASRAELVGRPSAADLASEPAFAVPVDMPVSVSSWDVVLIDTDAGLALAPGSYFPGQNSRAAITVITGTSFADLRSAPRDSLLYSQEPVPITADGLYVVRTRVAVCEGGSGSGVRYAKLRPVSIDAAAGTLRFETINNPFCGDRSFVPPN